MALTNTVRIAFLIIEVVGLIISATWLFWLARRGRGSANTLKKILVLSIVVTAVGLVWFSVLLYANFSFNEGVRTFENRNYQKAAQYLEAALKRRKSLDSLRVSFVARFTYQDIHKKLAVSYFEIHNYAKAAQEYQAALRYEKNDVFLLGGLGNSYLFVQDFEKAKYQFRKLVKLTPSSPDAHLFLGAAHEGLGEFGDAQKEYQKSISLDKNFALGYFYLAGLYARQNAKSEALAHLQRALEIEPSLRKKVREDQSFRNLKNDPDFEALMKGQNWQ